MATIRCPLYEAFACSAQEPAFIDEHRAMIYYELEMQCRGLTLQLRELGLGEGDVAGICLPNSAACVSLLFALFRVGAIAAPLSTRLPAKQRAEQLAQAGAGCLFTAGDAVDPDEHEMPVYDVEALLASAGDPPPELETPLFGLRQPATVVFTSGSGGAPKGVLHDVGAHYYSALGANINLHLRKGDRWLLSLPLYHVGGLGIVFRCLLGGAALVLPKPGEDLAEEAQLYGATHLSVVPTQLRRLLAAPDAEVLVQQLEAVLVGGAPVPPGLVDEAVRRGFPVHTTYGLTEMASQVTTTPPHPPASARHSAGGLLKYRELQLSPGGEILVRGETLCQGMRVDGETVPLTDEEGWYATGDLGAFIEDRWLVVKGRLDNRFVSGGENIHPEEIEQALVDGLGLEQAVVVPVPDPEYGERPVAFISGPADDDAEQLRARLEEYLPRFKIPDAFHPLPPEAEAGMKVDRMRLQGLAESLPR